MNYTGNDVPLATLSSQDPENFPTFSQPEPIFISNQNYLSVLSIGYMKYRTYRPNEQKSSTILKN